ncbi:hypothetical protein FNV43_RR27043 [Rhamnella rubrinervis]|uniref:Uncharacterized protein n=1 Tax=Rhamnella rubrinervis TaxID=2594499 RepID=A0A8K0DQG3_9ROSA|nr:hypothetical protein FNV43_RR27043 [Rhamnella rubrinervis]
MLEGFVRQLILGYLGRYVKDFQKEQLKITLWNEEVFLENVELILEAFDYLQLPFALREGHVGKLSIKIPWKKLGWDPIVIILEDVFFCTSQRDDEEWSSHAVEKREFAGKKAKLAAAELTKLSKRVCENRAGQSFISYITAKILDSIQVSIRSFHFLYRDTQGGSVHTMFGLKFSSLTIMKQNPFGSTSSRVKGGLVNKTVDIIGLELYCGTFHGPVDLMAMDNSRFEGKKCDFILAPCDLSMSLLVNRSGELDSNNPQYSINAELTGLKMSLDEVQLQQVLVLWDYLCTSQLREKYGRYRPWSSPLSKKMKGWKLLWWHYAQESVLSDVRKKLKKTSWRYLGQRLSYRRKYVNLYKIKLYFLRQEQSIDANTLGKLEQMEKDLDIDDILSYRSAAECELQEVFSNSSTSNINVNDASVAVEKSRTEDRLMGKSRGWLSWLSLGMLGAGGTDDCSQFSGVVSDEVIKDIYEATKFHPLNLSNGDAGTNDKIYLCEIKFSIHQISATLHSLKYNQEIAKLILNDAIIECKLWEESATIICCINSGQMLYPCIKKAILCLGRHTNDKSLLHSEHPCCTVQVDISPNHEVELAVKGMLQPLEVTFDANFFVNLTEFFGVLSSFESQHERVLSSLNRIKDVDVRLLSKAEYILSSRKNVTWDVSISNILINVPWGTEISEQWNLVFEVGDLLFSTKCDTGPLLADGQEKSYILKNLLDSISNSDLFLGNQFQDLNDHFAVKLNDLEMKIMMPFNSEPITLIEKFSTSIKLQSFMIPDESIWKQLEVYIYVSSLHAQFSPSIYGAVLGLIAYVDTSRPNSEPLYGESFGPCNVKPNGPRSRAFGFCVDVKFDLVILLVDLANDEESSTALIFSLQELDTRYFHSEFEEFWICLGAMNITTSPLSGESDSHVLYSSGNDSPIGAAVDIDIGYSNKIDVTDKSISTQMCFILHYESLKTELASQKCTICLNDSDVHCYPYIIRLLIGFIEKLSAFDTSGDGEHSFDSSVYAGNKRTDHHCGFQKFGFSNFLETGSIECASIPLDRFPFITIYNSGSLDNLESSLIYSSSEWRKKFSLRDKRIKSPQFSIKKVSQNFHFHASALKSTSGRQSYLASGSSGGNNLSVIDINLSGIRVHFHDSACIIGTVTLPSSNCSVCVNENCMDVLCSIEGLILTSSWWTKNFREFLWGAALPNLSPIINVRLRREKNGSSSSQFEMAFSIQHVYCILPPEYLAMIIGYFSLPDWSSDSKEQSINVGHEKSDAENEYSIIYKFEILDSILILPVESIEHQFLKVGIQQLCISFSRRGSLNNVFNGIPPESLIPEHKLARCNNCLNIFGRDLFLSLLSYDDGYGCVRLGQDTGCANATFLGPLSADVWVRIPCDSKSSSKTTASTTCVMISIANCQVMPDDHILVGFEALLDVLNQFILVSDYSKCFKSDVLQFLQLKRCLKENSAASPVGSSIVFTEVRCHVHSLLLEFYRFRKVSSELIAKGEMQFLCSASLENDSVTSFGLSFSSLALFSLPDSVILARCTSTCSTSSVLDISFSKLNQGENELHISVPSLDVWLHLSDWFEVIDLFTSYSEQLSRPASSDASLGNLTFDIVDTLGNMEVAVLPSSLHSSSASAYFASENLKQEGNIFLIVKSGNIFVTFHFPLMVSKESCSKVQVAEDHMKVPPNVPSNIIEGSGFKYIVVTLHSKSSVLLLDGRNVKLKSNIEKLSGIMTLCEDRSVHSWHLFQIFHIFLEAETSNKLMESVHVKMELECDHLDVSLSHHFFNFWHGVPVNHFEEGSSQFPFVGIDLKLQLRKVSFLLSDGRWSCSGPLFDILVRNILLHVYATKNNLEGSVTGEIQVSYNNIHKVFWEPFIEPWQFEMNMIRKQEMSLNSSAMINIHLQSRGHLCLNFTESLIECGFRTIEMIKDSWGVIESNDFPESQKLVNSPYVEHIYAGRYAPYVLQNLTSLPLVYHVCKGPVDGFDALEMKGGKSVQSGASIPIYIIDEPEDRLMHVRPTHSSDRLSDQKSNAHHYISIQLDGTSVPSVPISMDLVGLTYFEVDFSKAYDENCQENRAGSRSGFVVPVVFDVSVQRYSKLIRLYSTVILSNATSMPLELRFDIPFGVSPKILDPIYPGQELPLPLHLAEAGRMRWRPIGNSYLWSEIYNLSNLLSQETKIGFLKSFVCYPVHPSSDPFRCCISVTNITLPGCDGSNMSCHHRKSALNSPNESYSRKLHTLDESSKRFVHQLTLSTPLVVNNYLPKEVSLAIESAGVTRNTFLSEVETFFHHIDPSHDLGMEISIDGFKSSTLKFPRSETFCMMAKISGAKFSLSETLTFDTDMANGKTYVAVEKMMDAFSGARELFIYVPFLLYNCTGFPLLISESVTEMKGVSCTILSSYDMVEQIVLEEKKDGLSLVSSTGNPHAKNPSSMESSSSSHIISTRDTVSLHKKRLICSLISSNSNENFIEPLIKNNVENQISSLSSSKDRLLSSNSGWASRNSNFIGYEHGKVRACMYSPIPFSAASELMVRVRRCQPERYTKDMPNSLWSSPFHLVPPSGSTTVLVPQSSQNASFVVSVTSSAVSGPLTGRISAITFQPKYVICNACSKDLCYKQKGTDFVFNLRMGVHSHLHWMDSTRELLVCIRYNEPGWQWSGGFLPEHLGDTQVKMRDYVSSSLNIIRVEVQNADVSIGDEKIVGSLHGNSGTNLILLSDDDTGFMPYRVDNFSRERLRIFQQRCEAFETIVHSYTSCPYAWDEPCYPHRLIVEVPGECVLGSYALDDVKEYKPVFLPSSSEKPERTLLLSVHAEGATKVLRVIDSSYHILNDMESTSVPHLRDKRKLENKQDKVFSYKEKISVVIPHIGISLINLHPQELLFAWATNVTVDLLQSLDQQQLFFQIFSLQIDNQLRSSPYPVMLSFDREYKSNPSGLVRANDNGVKPRSDRILQMTADSSLEPVFNLAVSKWRKKDISLVSFQYISLRVADFRLELEQEVILSLFDFFKNVSSRLQSGVIPLSDPLMRPLIHDNRSIESLAHVQTSEYLKARGNQFHFKIVPVLNENHCQNLSLPCVIPIGAPWQKIHLLARRQRKIYVEMLDLGPIKLTLSFSSAPWMLRKGILTSGESLIHRGLMAVADVEGARIHLKQLAIAHHITSLESMQEILIRHYTRQLLHEMYKVFGSAGVIGNPMGFARSLGLGIRDFLSVPARSIFQSPTGLITGMAQGTTSLLSNTVYAISDATTQFSRAAHKGIVAFTFDDQTVSRMEHQQMVVASHSKGVINEVLEGLTGLLQSPIKGAEKHGLPGVLSGIALGITGLVARPAASILQVTGKTAQSIRNRSRVYQMGPQRFRIRLPRPLSREFPLKPYSWEEAVGTSVLVEADDSLRLKDEVFVLCKALRQAGKFVIITERLVLIVSCSCLVDLGKPEFRGIPFDLEWIVESEIGLESVIHADYDQEVVHIVGSSSDILLRHTQQDKRGGATRTVRWSCPTLPLIQTNLELAYREDAENFLRVLLSTIELGKVHGWGCRYLLHRGGIKNVRSGA